MAAGGAPAISLPRKPMRPALGLSSPESTLLRVDLPAPLLPSTATISPAAMAKSMPRSTGSAP
jgi:hypothetical protein